MSFMHMRQNCFMYQYANMVLIELLTAAKALGRTFLGIEFLYSSRITYSYFKLEKFIHINFK